MSGYEQRLAEDKRHLRSRTFAVGRSVEDAVREAARSLLERDAKASSRIMLGDLPINREIRSITQACHAFIARHIPSAGHLRFVSSVMQMAIALERIGDYAVTVAREAVQLQHPVPDGLSSDLASLTDQACTVLGEAMVAFSERDKELARNTRPRAKEIERIYGHIYRTLADNRAGLPLPDAFALLAAFRAVERVADQAKNISEETLFELTGEMKAPKRYKVLFVDRDGTCIAPLAEALARRAFPGSGEYASAAVAPAAEIPVPIREQALRRGVELGVVPFPLDGQLSALEQFHVVVCMESGIRAHVSRIPYSTALLEWEFPAPSQLDPATFDSIANRISQEIHDLMILLRGEDAP